MSDPLALRVRYAVLGFSAWVALRVFGLRRDVIRDNLRRSFPERTQSELRAVECEFVRRQGELAAELSYSGRMSAEQLRARVNIVNPEVLAAAGQPRPLMLLGAHQCNFEWMLQRISLELGERLVALYKPPRNRRSDRWLRRLRARHGARLISAKSVLRELAAMKNVGAIGMLADQVPRTSPEKLWLPFLGRDTAFYVGGELLGRALRAQACAVQMRRLERGRYELTLVPLNAPGEKLPQGEVTTRYARALESWIREDPAGWWWTHRRWKLTPGSPASAPGASPAG